MGLERISAEGRNKGNPHSHPSPPPHPTPASTVVMDFPNEGKLYLAALLQEWEGNIWWESKIESIIVLFKTAHLKEEHKSFLCPEPLSVLYAFDCGCAAGGDREGVVRKSLLSGNSLLVMYPFEGVESCIYRVYVGKTCQRITEK